MTQIFTGTGLGLHGSSLGQLSHYGPKGSAKLGQGGHSVYVNAANGNLVVKQSDGFLPHASVGLDLFQSYNSLHSASWRFNTDTKLLFEGKANSPHSSVRRTDEDGHITCFTYNANQKAYVADDSSLAQLIFNDTDWTYQDGSTQTICHYNTEGQLTHINDQDGNTLNFTYQNGHLITIKDNTGRQSITWSFHQGILHEITFQSDGQTLYQLHYDYDAHHRLNRVTRDLGDGTRYWTVYDYVDDSTLISDLRESDGTHLHIDYDAEGRIKRLTDGEGRTTSYDYLYEKTVITDGLGKSWTYHYDSQARLTGIDGPEDYRIRYHYEGKHLVLITQGNQHWTFAYNDAGDCIRMDSPTGEVVLRTYDVDHHVLKETRYQIFDGQHQPALPNTTHCVYDIRGHLRFEITADGVVTEHRYDTNGYRSSSRCYLQGHYSSQSSSLEELTNWSQMQIQQAISLIEYKHDWRGCLSEEIRYTQISVSGEGLSTQDTWHTYSQHDAAGRLIEQSSMTTNGLTTTRYLYDNLGRLIKTIDNQQHTQTIEYDDAHQRILRTDTNGLKTLTIYDKSGLLLSTQQLDSTHDYGTKTYNYDAAGHLIAETDVTGKTHYLFYDARDRLKADVSFNGNVTEYLYDNEDRCIQTIQYQQIVHINTRLSYETFKPKATKNDRISQVVYNQYNQVAYLVNAEGAVIAVHYDAQGRLTSKTAYARRLTHFQPEKTLTYEEITLTPHTDDRSVTYYYDVNGRLQAEINGEGFATVYRYDAQGHLIESRRFANKGELIRSGEWIHDAPSPNDTKDIRTYCLYNAAGLKIADIDAERYLTEYVYDNQGLLISKIGSYQQLQVDLIIDSTTTLNEIRPQAHHNDHRTTYVYNDLNQLINECTPSGLMITYRYNAAGQVINETRTDSRTHDVRSQHYRYDTLGRITQSLDATGAALLAQIPLGNPTDIETVWQQHSVSYLYDISGHLVSKTNALNETTHYLYNDAGLLNYTINATGAITETRYNSFQQIETTVRYSAYYPIETGINLSAIKTFIQQKANSAVDEVTHYEYNALGLLVSQHNQGGGTQNTTYNAFGERETTLEHSDTTLDNLTQYQYDHRGLLRQRIEDFGGINKSFNLQYDAFSQVEQQWDGQHHLTTYARNKRGELIHLGNQDHELKSMEYDAFGRLLSVRDKTRLRYTYNDQLNTLTLEYEGTSSSVITQFSAFGDTLAITDGNRNTTRYQYDAQGQLLHVDSPEHTTIDYTYDAAGRLLLQQDAGGHVRRFTYDAAGRVLTQTLDPDGLNITTSYQYDAIGRQLQVIDAGRCTQFSYDNQGHLIQTRQDPNGLNLVTTFRYNDLGQLIYESHLNPQGQDQITTYTRDALGRCLTRTLDPDGLRITTRYTYDQNDNIIQQCDPNQNVTHYIYDINNRVRYRIDADGRVIEHCYDKQGNETKTTAYAQRIPLASAYDEALITQLLHPNDKADHHQFFVYDQHSRKIRSYDGLGYATEYRYDANNNLIAIKNYDRPCSLSDLTNGYNPLPETQGHARQTQFIYDGLNQVRFQINPQGLVTEFCYNLAGQRIEQIRYSHPLTDKNNAVTLDTIQTTLQHNAEQDQSIKYVYDNADRLILQASSEGSITSYEYDAAGNQTASHQYATQLSATQLLDSDWAKHIQASSDDRITRAVYDAAGRAIFRISPSGHVVERGYDAVGNVLFERANETRITQFEYDAIGRLLTQTDAAQQTTRFTYDKNNNVATKTEANNAEWRYHYNAANQVIETISPITTITIFKIDRSHEETREIITRHEYDAFGNLIRQIRDAGGVNQTIQYTFDANNRKIETIYPNVAINNASQRASNERQEIIKTLTESSVYNAFGEVIEQRDRAGYSHHFAYDDLGQQIFAIDSLGAVTHFEYDSLGQLCKKTAYATRLNTQDYTTKNIALSIQNSALDRHEHYVYDKDQRLIEIRKDAVRSYNPKTASYQTLSPTTRLTYNAFGDTLTQAIQRSNTEWSITTHTYDIDGLKIATLDAEHYLTTYHYNRFGLLDEETQYATRGRSPTSSPKDRTIILMYDVKGQLIEKTLKNVEVSRLIGQSNQYETIIADLTSRYGYDAMGNMVSTTDAEGHTAYSYYDSLGQLTAKVGIETPRGRAATTYRFNSLGQRVQSRQWANGADASSASELMLHQLSGMDIVVRDIYDDSGQRIETINSNGHITQYSYDANGNVARSWRKINPWLISDKHYHYDHDNRLIQTAIMNDKGLRTTEDALYNTFGEIIKKGVDGHFSTQLDYDLAGRTWRSNVQGYFQIYLYDLCNQVTQVLTSSHDNESHLNELGVDLSSATYTADTDFSHAHSLYDLQRHDNTYDALGHLVSQTQRTDTTSIDPNASMVSTSQTVDRWGNLLSSTNASGYTTRYDYNALNALTQQILPEVAVVDEHGVSHRLAPVNHYAIDSLGRTIAMTDANGHTVAHVYDAEGHITQDIDARGHHRDKTYNLLGQMTTQTNERGGITSYSYDAQNRLLSVVSSQTAQYYEYDGADQLVRQTDATGNINTLIYDELGHLIQKTSQNATTTYEYDTAGHKIAERDANGNSNRWRYDENGRVAEHTNLGGHQTHYTYNNNGLILTEQSSAGKDIQYSYYSDGRMREYHDKPRHETVKFTYDSAGNITSKSMQNMAAVSGETDHYEYDELGRMTHVKRLKNDSPQPQNPKLSIDYEYDAVGNIRDSQVIANFDKNQTSTQTDYFLYDENNRKIVSKGQLINHQITITNTQGSSLSYDATGNIADAQLYEKGIYQHYTYTYNTDNLLEFTYNNNHLIQLQRYQDGRLIGQTLYTDTNKPTQNNLTYYQNGRVVKQVITDGHAKQVSETTYEYDTVGNITQLITHQDNLIDTHKYSYELWDGYLQKTDELTWRIRLGKNKHFDEFTTTLSNMYDVNGLLTDINHSVSGNRSHYVASCLDGMITKEETEGKTNYLTLGGKTIGEVCVDFLNQQLLDLYDTSDIPNMGQDNLGTYTLNAGDTLDSIAQHIYGDSSLWYLIADANGITDRTAHAGEKGGPLHIGQRINIPSIAKGQHNTNTSATTNQSLDQVFRQGTLTPAPPGNKQNNHGFLKTIAKITVAVTAAVAMVMSAGALAILAAGTSLSGIGLGTLISTGLSALGGSALTGIGAGASLGMTSTLAVGFAAGFTSSIAGQTAANLLHLQNGIDWRDALLSSLGTAATASLGHLMNASAGYAQLRDAIARSSPRLFNVVSATEMLERDSISQALNLALNHHQHFDWLELGVSAATAGIMGSQAIQTASQVAQQKGGRLSAFVISEAEALATGAATGHYDALQVLQDNLGNALSASLLQQPLTPNEQEGTQIQDTDEGGYCPIPTQQEDGAYSAIPEGTWERFHRENELRKHLEHVNAQYLNETSENEAVVFNGAGSLGVLGDVAYGEGQGGGLGVGQGALVFSSQNEIKQGNFNLIQNLIFNHEGNISNNLNDFGGYTNKGITLSTFELHAQKDLGITPSLNNLKKLTNEQAEIIYKKHFWDPLKADNINSKSVAYTLYDFHVNAPSQAVQLMQKTVNSLGGKLIVDNKMGINTINAINKLDSHQLFDAYQKNRIDYYTQRVNTLPSQKVFLNGWLNRVNSIKFGD